MTATPVTLGRRGFTLVELVIVVLVMGILAGVAAPRYASTLQRIRIDSTAKRIKADLGLARQKAIASSTTQTVEFSPATISYTLPGMADLNHPGQTYSVDLAAAPFNTTTLSANLGGDSDIQFDHYGQPDSGGTITVLAGSVERTVTVDQDTGKAGFP